MNPSKVFYSRGLFLSTHSGCWGHHSYCDFCVGFPKFVQPYLYTATILDTCKMHFFKKVIAVSVAARNGGLVGPFPRQLAPEKAICICLTTRLYPD